MGARHGSARRRKHYRPGHPDLFARRASAFRRHQHFHEGALRRECARRREYDAAVIGIPFDSGTTYRPGTRFGPQGIRRISALYTPYNYELGVDLREQMTLCDAGDVFTIPANLEKSFDQISRGVAHVFSSGALPIMLGGDHSIGFPCVRGIAQCTDRRSASSISTAISTSRKRISTNACIPRPGSGRPTCQTSRRSIWCNSASGAGRCRARVLRSRASATPTC